MNLKWLIKLKNIFLKRKTVLFVGSPIHESYRPDLCDCHIDWKSHVETCSAIRYLIKNNPNIKFVYKFHPRDTNIKSTKVLFGGIDIKFAKRQPLFSLLKNADYVMGYESTAISEAILLVKKTMIINMCSDFHFPYVKDGISLGAKSKRDIIDCFNKLISLEDIK